MTSGRGPITRRNWATIIATAPAFFLPVLLAGAQPPATVPPEGVPAAPSAALTPQQKLQKAYADVHQASMRLSQIEIPMDVEPAFSFKV